MVSKSKEHTTFKQQLMQCLQDQEHSTLASKESLRNKNAIILIGNTRSGKSTLANYLLNNNLTAWEENKKIFKIKINGLCEEPKIGQGSLSCTTKPGVYSIPGDTDTVIIDSPGFGDNRGVLQDVINAVYIKQIKAARRVKFVLVFDISDITNDNIEQFKHTLQQTQKLVRNFDEVKHSFCAIFMKEFRNYTQNDIVELFRNKILSVEELNMDKILVRNFVNNKKLIGIFKMPMQAGEVSLDVDVNVKGAIEECHWVEVGNCEILVALSDRAQKVLSEIYLEYTDQHFFQRQISNKVTEEFTAYFNIDKYVYASYDEELKNAKDNLIIIATCLFNHAQEQRSDLSQIQVSLDQLLKGCTCDEFKANLKLMVILYDYNLLEKGLESKVMTNYKNFLSELHEKVNTLLKKIDAEMEERMKYNITFGVVGSTSAIALATGTVAGAAQVVGGTFATAEVATGGVATVAVGVVGAAACVVGIITAAILYHNRYGKRKKARKAQGRKL